MRYHIQLSAMVQAQYTISVEADSVELALEHARTRCSANPRDWEVIDGGFVDDVEPAAYQTDDDEEWTDL